MLASMCKLKVGRLSREVGFFSMMLMLKSLMLMFMKMVFVMLITMMLICTVYVDQGGTVTKRLLNDFPVQPRKLTNQLFSVISAPGPWEKMRLPHFFFFQPRKPDHIFRIFSSFTQNVFFFI